MNVGSKKAIAKIITRFLKAAKTRNIIVIFAIALTSIMFTSIFTITGNMLAAIQEQTMRQVGTSAHGGLRYLTTEQYERFARSPLIREMSYSLYLGNAENLALRETLHEIRFAKDDMASWSFSHPTVGSMPSSDNEIAMSSITLDALGLPHEIGVSVPLEFSVGDTGFYKTFSLSGYWIGDAIMPAQFIWLSDEYVYRTLNNAVITDNFTGTINADIWFANTFDIEGRIQRLIAEHGYAPDDISYGVNWAYTTTIIGTDAATIAIISLVLALILLAGYLIIYSIFVISINTDIHFYGLIKTVGATVKQIRKIVRGQALILSIIAIPIGLLLGYFFGTELTPLILGVFTELGGHSVSASPLIFVFSATFSLITVFTGCRKPAGIAANVSPVEATKYNGSSASSKRKAKKTRKVTMLGVAWANITRDKRKLCARVLSLSLSLIILNSVFSAVRSFDMEAYLSGSLISDFTVAHYSVFGTGEKNTSGVTTDFLREAARRGADEISSIYHLDVATAQVYGVGKMELLHFSDIGFQRLSSGNYAIVSSQAFSFGDNPVEIPNVGDTLTLANDNGIMRDFEVIGLIDTYPFQLSARYRIANSLDVIIADNKFLDFFGSQGAMQTNINVSAENMEHFEEWLERYTQSENPDLSFISRNTLISEFDGLQTTYLVLGGFLSVILALVGLLNFINATTASIIARRRELSMLQSVGMTGKQLLRTLFFEGCCHAVISLFLTLTFGLALGLLFIQIIAGQVWFFSRSFTILPTVISALPLIAICAITPLVCYNRLTRDSLVERLRVE